MHPNEIKAMCFKITFLYQKALIRTFHTTFFYYKIPPVNSQLENTYSKGDFVLKDRFKTFVVKILSIEKYLRFGMKNSINKHLRLKIHYTQHTFLTLSNNWLNSPNQIWVKNIYFSILRNIFLIRLFILSYFL